MRTLAPGIRIVRQWPLDFSTYRIDQRNKSSERTIVRVNVEGDQAYQYFLYTYGSLWGETNRAEILNLVQSSRRSELVTLVLVLSILLFIITSIVFSWMGWGAKNVSGAPGFGPNVPNRLRAH